MHNWKLPLFMRIHWGLRKGNWLVGCGNNIILFLKSNYGKKEKGSKKRKIK